MMNSRTERVQAVIRTHGIHATTEVAEAVVRAVTEAPKEFDQSKSDRKTIDEAIENAIAGVGTIAAAAVTAGIGKLPADKKRALTVTASLMPVVMGILKTLIRRIKNRRKHRKQ